MILYYVSGIHVQVACVIVYLPDSNRYDIMLCFRNTFTSGLCDPVYTPGTKYIGGI